MIAQADAVRIPLPDQSVHCCMTSPPYWGLRKYAGEQGEEPLGLEPTPERHVERIVEIFREVRRVLRDDGVVWLNYGDSYSGVGGDNFNSGLGNSVPAAREWITNSVRKATIKGGNLTMMPHRVALALQADGWIVRQDLVWYKRNPMPESLAGTRWVKHRIKEGRSKHASDHNIKGGTQKMLEDASVHQGIDEDWVPEYVDCPGCEKCIPDDGLVLKRGSWRHTRAHEYVFMLTKKMQYWSNQEAVREGAESRPMKNPDGWDTGDGAHGTIHRDGREKGRQTSTVNSGRNPRSVLDIPTAPYKGAHYATFPPNLIAPLIRATCPRWACPRCGQGWAAVVERKGSYEGWAGRGEKNEALFQSGDGATKGTTLNIGSKEDYYANQPRNNVIGYKPTCSHEHTQEEAVPGTVFDPFVGSGTTVKVAQDLLRRGIGIDISMEYLDLQAKLRTKTGTPSNQFENLPLFE